MLFFMMLQCQQYIGFCRNFSLLSFGEEAEEEEEMVKQVSQVLKYKYTFSDGGHFIVRQTIKTDYICHWAFGRSFTHSHYVCGLSF